MQYNLPLFVLCLFSFHSFELQILRLCWCASFYFVKSCPLCTEAHSIFPYIWLSVKAVALFICIESTLC